MPSYAWRAEPLLSLHQAQSRLIQRVVAWRLVMAAGVSLPTHPSTEVTVKLAHRLLRSYQSHEATNWIIDYCVPAGWPVPGGWCSQVVPAPRATNAPSSLLLWLSEKQGCCQQLFHLAAPVLSGHWLAKGSTVFWCPEPMQMAAVRCWFWKQRRQQDLMLVRLTNFLPHPQDFYLKRAETLA